MKEEHAWDLSQEQTKNNSCISDMEMGIFIRYIINNSYLNFDAEPYYKGSKSSKKSFFQPWKYTHIAKKPRRWSYLNLSFRSLLWSVKNLGFCFFFSSGSCFPFSCYTSVGMQYRGNFINLAPGCFTHGVLIHEIMHGLGVWHEQSRGDRDQYIKINYHNMKCCKYIIYISRTLLVKISKVFPKCFFYQCFIPKERI